MSEAVKIEDLTFQETGTPNHFVTVRASRLAIGHDKKGRLMIVELDGDGNHNKGFNLYELADLMIQLGAVNAINLDGIIS